VYSRLGGRQRIHHGDAIRRFDYAVGQRRSLAQGRENGRRREDALALDAQHLAPVKTPQRAAFVRAARRPPWGRADLVQQFGLAQQFVGEVRAVFENIEHAGGQFAVALQAVEHCRIGKRLLQKMVEAHAAAIQSRPATMAANCGARWSSRRVRLLTGGLIRALPHGSGSGSGES
jgi:hypothetical protein